MTFSYVSKVTRNESKGLFFTSSQYLLSQSYLEIINCTAENRTVKTKGLKAYRELRQQQDKYQNLYLNLNVE